MDEKTGLTTHTMRPRRDRRTLSKLVLAGFITLAALMWLRTYTGPAALLPYRGYKVTENSGRLSSSKRRVPLEAHIMSKCPDSRDCLHDLVLPAMQRIHDKVNFTLSYIGR